MGKKEARGLTDAEVESGCVQVGHLLHLEYGYLDEKLREMMRCCYRAGFAKLGRLELIESALNAPDEPSEKKPLLSYEDIRAFAQDSAPYASFVEEGVRWARDESVKWFLALLPTDAELERRYSGYVIKMVREDAIREAKFTRDEIKKRLEAGK